MTSVITLAESAAPNTPSSGYARLYVDSTGRPFVLTDGGLVYDLAGAVLDITNVSSPPTDAELDSAFGAPSAAKAGKFWLLDDNNADTTVYLVTTNGTSWWYSSMTKAT